MNDLSGAGYLSVIREFLVSARFCALLAISITIVLLEPPLVSDLVSLSDAPAIAKLVVGCVYVLATVGLVLHLTTAISVRYRRARRRKQFGDQVWSLSAKELVVLSDAAYRGEMAVTLPPSGIVARSLMEKGFLRLRAGRGSPLRYAFAVDHEAASAMAVLRASMEDKNSDIHAAHLQALRREYHEYLRSPVYTFERW